MILKKMSYKNKIVLSTFTVISLLGAGAFFSIHWVLLPNLLSQLKLRGLDIAESVAESSRGYILTENIPELTSLIFDTARLEERRALIAYIFVLDKQQEVLSHTFTFPFPEWLGKANILHPDQSHSIRQVRVDRGSAYDIAVPIREGTYQVGTVHVGLNKQHIDHLIGKLMTTFLVIICAIVVIGFFISQYLSRYISRPILHLTQMADEISRGNFDVKPTLKSEIRCWEIKMCDQKNCPAYHNVDVPCWYIDGTFRGESLDGILMPVRPSGKFPEKIDYCKGCIVYAKGAGDEIVQLADSFSNMTYRLRISEAEVKKSEEKYRALFDSTPNSIFVLEPESLKILDANARAVEIYGWQKAQLVEKTFMDLGAYHYTEGVLSGTEQQPSTMSSVYPKVQHYRRDGTPFYVNVYACQSRGNHEHGIVAVTVDITESLEKESQLIQASKMSTLGEMASGVAHEINQPLSAIQIGADFIHNVVSQEQEFPQSDLALVSEHIREQVDRAVRIINHLREFGRKAEIKKEKVYINKPIEGVFTLLGQQLKLRDIKVLLELDDDLPPIMADSNRLEQVFIDLVVNARDAMEEKKQRFIGGKVEGALKVKSFSESGRVVVSVSDTGVGIPDELKDKIFEPFFTSKEVGKGTGLGLSISYSIVKDYDGTMEIESEVGKGTTFKLSFPIWDEDHNED